MAGFGSRCVQGVALLLIAVAVPVVLWLPHPRTDDDLGGRIGATGLSASNVLDDSGDPVTYRFLYRDEAGAISDRLTLARFVGRERREGQRWGFASTAQWFDWAPEIFVREQGWGAENQPGWQISGWLQPNAWVECDREHLFWAIQALRFLDPESFANEIDMLERSGYAVRICPTQGLSDYDYGSDTLYWNPISAQHVATDARLNWKWFRSDPLVALAHELKHAWHDLCRNGDAAGVEARECLAIAAENRIRHILFLTHPACSHLYPRPGHQETRPDLPGSSAHDAWGNYHGIVQY